MPKGGAPREAPRGAHRERIAVEAADWLVKAVGGKMTAREQAAFDAWLAADPEHAEVYANVERLWRGSSELPEIKSRNTKARKTASKLTRRDAGKAIIALGLGFVGWRYFADHPFADYRTGTGERQSIDTPDGTRIDLAAQSRLSLVFDDRARRITLHEGEAFFRVAKDPRPFRVTAGEGVTTALGTAFGVRYREHKARVIVTEHATRVTLGGGSAQVDAGYEVEYETRLGAVEQGDPGEALSWRDGRLVFNGTPLGEVVDAINLWRRGTIAVVGGDLARRPVTLIADVNRLGAIDEEIERSMRVRAVKITPLLILLLPAS